MKNAQSPPFSSSTAGCAGRSLLPAQVLKESVEKQVSYLKTYSKAATGEVICSQNIVGLHERHSSEGRACGAEQQCGKPLDPTRGMPSGALAVGGVLACMAR